jgi:hypothetical protein
MHSTPLLHLLGNKILAVAALLLCTLLTPASLRAQTQTQSDQQSQQAQSAQPPQQGTAATQAAISTDRPSITDSSLVVPSGDLLFENGFTETAAQGERAFDFPEMLIRFGLTSHTELRITPPEYFQNFSTVSGFASGFGDFSFGIKQQLLATSQSFTAALILSLSIPTGAKALSSHGYDPSILLPWSHPIARNWVAAGMFSLLFPTEGGSHNMTGQASFLIDRQLTPKWDAFLEYGGEFPSLGTPQHTFHSGTSYKITANQQLDVHFGVGFSGATPDHFIGFGYSFQFPSAFRRMPRLNR